MMPIKAILHPNDYSAHSEAAFHLACALARDYHARLVVIHVAQSPPASLDEALDERLAERFRKTLEEEVLYLQAKGFPLEVEYYEHAKDPAAIILEAAKDRNADMIVMGTHGRSGVGRLFMGSVAEYVLRRALCPVVTVTKPAPVSEGKPKERKPVLSRKEEAVTLF
jgi:nucleotide-binding universal stress UspA family protein